MTAGERRRTGMKRLATRLHEQRGEGARLDAAIAASLKALGFGERGG